MKNKLLVILGNQLFNPNLIKDYKNDHLIFMCEDHGLCTYERHHKQKILFFLSSMRSYANELEDLQFDVIYKKIDEKEFTTSYCEKLTKEIKERGISEISIHEIKNKILDLRFLLK